MDRTERILVNSKSPRPAKKASSPAAPRQGTVQQADGRVTATGTAPVSW